MRASPTDDNAGIAPKIERDLPDHFLSWYKEAINALSLEGIPTVSFTQESLSSFVAIRDTLETELDVNEVCHNYIWQDLLTSHRFSRNS